MRRGQEDGAPGAKHFSSAASGRMRTGKATWRRYRSSAGMEIPRNPTCSDLFTLNA